MLSTLSVISSTQIMENGSIGECTLFGCGIFIVKLVNICKLATPRLCNGYQTNQTFRKRKIAVPGRHNNVAHPVDARGGAPVTRGPPSRVLIFCAHGKKKGKGSFYIAQYPVRWTAQSASHFLPSLTDLFIPTPFSASPGSNTATD